MCQRTTCNECKKPDWSGCGQHIEQALAGVPVDLRCKCEKQRNGCKIFWINEFISFILYFYRLTLLNYFFHWK